MRKLTSEERSKISEAVKKAELQTSGEIATAVIRQSNNYAIYELSFAVAVSLIYGIILVLFTGAIETWLQGMFWGYESGYLTGFYVFSTFLLLLVLYFIANIPIIDRLIVPKKARNEWVHRRALQYFSESGVGHTKDNTGILIFISLLEQRVELLADSGIAEKIAEDTWQKIVDHIIEGIKNDNLTGTLCESIGECGNILGKEFPRMDDDENELADGIVELNE